MASNFLKLKRTLKEKFDFSHTYNSLTTLAKLLLVYKDLQVPQRFISERRGRRVQNVLQSYSLHVSHWEDRTNPIHVSIDTKLCDCYSDFQHKMR